MEGGCKLSRNHCILAVNFESQEIQNCSKFIKSVKQIKETYIESVYEENDSKLIYASPYYLKIIDKGSVDNYKKFKRERSYSEDEIMILTPFQK